MKLGKKGIIGTPMLTPIMRAESVNPKVEVVPKLEPPKGGELAKRLVPMPTYKAMPKVSGPKPRKKAAAVRAARGY